MRRRQTTPQMPAPTPIGSVGVTTAPSTPGNSGSSVVTIEPTTNIQPTSRPASGRSSTTCTPMSPMGRVIGSLSGVPQPHDFSRAAKDQETGATDQREVQRDLRGDEQQHGQRDQPGGAGEPRGPPSRSVGAREHPAP